MHPMKHKRILQVTIYAWLACGSPAALAQTVVVTYVLEDVWLLPDISHPGQPARQMTGTFEWTYDVGDFENGTGELIEVHIPWDNPDIWEVNSTIELTSIEFSLIGKWKDRGIDVTLFLVEPFSPDQPAAIDTTNSVFEIQHGIAWQGHIVSGSIVPTLDNCTVDLNGDGQSDLADFALLVGCASGPEQPLGAGCQPADMDGDGDVDRSDFAVLQVLFGCQ